MAVLSDLPNEILDLVLDYAHPRDLEAFLSTSRCYRQTYERLLEKHYALKRKYSTFTYHPSTPWGAPVRLVKEIGKQPRIADYVVKLDVEKLQERAFNEWDQTDHRPEVAAEDLELLRKAMEGSQYLGKKCLRYLDSGLHQEEGVLILLLTMLPNLEEIRSLEDYSNIDVTGTLSQITSKQPIPLLSRLERVHLEVKHCEIEEGALDDLNLLYFCKLPSMRSMTMHNAGPSLWEDEDEGTILRLYPSMHGCSLTSLTLLSCYLSPKVVRKFLCRCVSLESFAYSTGRYTPGDEDDPFDPSNIREAVEKNCTSTLKNLHFAVRNSKRHRRRDDAQGLLGSLKPFDKLETLDSDLELLIGEVEDPEFLSGDDSDADTDGAPDKKERRISDYLPPSLVRLNLWVRDLDYAWSLEDYRWRYPIKKLLESVEEKHPSLQWINLACVSGGVSLELIRGSSRVGPNRGTELIAVIES